MVCHREKIAWGPTKAADDLSPCIIKRAAVDVVKWPVLNFCFPPRNRPCQVVAIKGTT